MLYSLGVLVRDGETIVAAWMLGGELPDIDAVLAAARNSALELHASGEIVATSRQAIRPSIQ